MEEFNLVLNAIGSIGFPAVMCLILTKMMRESDRRHEDETSRLAEALSNNTQALALLKEKIEELRTTKGD